MATVLPQIMANLITTVLVTRVDKHHNHNKCLCQVFIVLTDISLWCDNACATHNHAHTINFVWQFIIMYHVMCRLSSMLRTMVW